MGLKELLSKAKGINQVANRAGSATVPGFKTLDYNLHHITPKKEDILAILKEATERIERDGEHLNTETQKALIMGAYRLALSQDARASGVFHPSEISREQILCHRKMYFQKARVKKDATFVNFTSDNRMMRLVDLGTLIHLYIQENLQRLGVLKDFESDVDAPEFGIKGKMDGVVTFVGEDDLGKFYKEEDMALEIKSINSYGFKMLRKPKDDHIRQASIYAHFLGYNRICFIYYCKDTSALKIFVWDVNHDYVNDLKPTASGIIKQYNTNLRKHRSKKVELHDDIPPKLCSDRTISRAMECPFADFCFKHRTP